MWMAFVGLLLYFFFANIELFFEVPFGVLFLLVPHVFFVLKFVLAPVENGWEFDDNHSPVRPCGSKFMACTSTWCPIVTGNAGMGKHDWYFGCIRAARHSLFQSLCWCSHIIGISSTHRLVIIALALLNITHLYVSGTTSGFRIFVNSKFSWVS